MSYELLDPGEMAQADFLTIAGSPDKGLDLMRNAGAAVASAILARFPGMSGADILCGPGNNGGDGYIVARLLHEAGLPVTLWSLGDPKSGTDAALAARECGLRPRKLGDFRPHPSRLVVDAIFGAGLSKPVEGDIALCLQRVEESGAPVVAVDLPSGISGASGKVLGKSVRADVTVTFFRKKPGHLLEPGRSFCGETIVADIGIHDDVLGEIKPSCFENHPRLWRASLPFPGVEAHKYARGHACVFSGGASATGAARLAALAAARAGAGATTVLSPGSAMQVNAAHLTAIMLRRIDGVDDLNLFSQERKPSSYVVGPGFGVGQLVREFVLSILRERETSCRGLVVDADAITSFAKEPEALFEAAKADGAPSVVMTPHVGEFRRIFPDLAEGDTGSKLEAARAAADRANAVIVYKGPDSVIAAPDGRARINSNGTPFLATAGSGDVLGGIVAGLMAQGMPAFDAACAGVWIHAEAGQRFGPGLIADDLPSLLPAVMADLKAFKDN
jgi:ADP-dependent NAD(P)H-hydrate dehydratase / NAD(P)H-hydrate epimerase